MERLFFGITIGCFLAIITINTISILTLGNSNVEASPNNSDRECFLKGRREC